MKTHEEGEMLLKSVVRFPDLRTLAALESTWGKGAGVGEGEFEEQNVAGRGQGSC